MNGMPPPFDAAWFQALIGVIVGLALGSFITMLAYRLPHRFSIITPPSHCPNCKKHLAARDLVPVFSWLWNKGKCRYCGVKIGARYLRIEIATGLACAVAFVVLGFDFALMIAVLLIVIVITIVAIAASRKLHTRT
jgi:prepilin signal peptidase PulO-like enzyme (type II secretory pathway)